MYDPWVTRQLTLRDLLCHRSGLPDHGGDLLEDLGYDQAEVLHRLQYLKPASSFRSQFAYTNYGYTEAAVAAAKAVGKLWEAVAAEKLYRPLGMKATSSLSGLCERSQPRCDSRAGGRKVCCGEYPQCRRSNAGRRGNLQCARHGAMAAAATGQWQN